MDFVVPTDLRVKIKESEKRDKYLDLASELKTMEHEGVWWTWDNSQRIGKETGIIGNKRPSRDHADYSIIDISQNTEKSPEDLRRLSVTQTTVRNYQLTLVWKTLPN